jgi:hypothetical protein
MDRAVAALPDANRHDVVLSGMGDGALEPQRGSVILHGSVFRSLFRR